jgi:hypothetical protein
MGQRVPIVGITPPSSWLHVARAGERAGRLSTMFDIILETIYRR